MPSYLSWLPWGRVSGVSVARITGGRQGSSGVLSSSVLTVSWGNEPSLGCHWLLLQPALIKPRFSPAPDTCTSARFCQSLRPGPNAEMGRCLLLLHLLLILCSQLDLLQGEALGSSGGQWGLMRIRDPGEWCFPAPGGTSLPDSRSTCLVLTCPQQVR